MSPTAESPPGGPSVVVWGLRRYAWFVIVIAGVTAAVALLISQSTGTQYETRSLVVAQKLTISTLSLPRYAESVFDSGTLEAKLDSNPAFADLDKPLIPDLLDVEVAKDSVVLNVIGRAPTAAQATRLADTATAIYVEELNAAGAGVGIFATQASAPTPGSPAGSVLPAPIAVVLGLGAGGMLGVGLVLLFLVVARPVIDAHGVEEVTGLPLLAIINIPHGPRSGLDAPLPIRGISALVRRLAQPGPARITVLSRKAVDPTRAKLVEGLAEASTRSIEPLTFIDGASQGSLPVSVSGTGTPASHPAKRQLGKADASESILLTAPVGIRGSRFRKWTSAYPEHETCGVVLLSRHK